MCWQLRGALLQSLRLPGQQQLQHQQNALHPHGKYFACWHGGAKSWEKSDWSPIFNRDVYIFPDNDDVGKEAAWELGKYLKKNGCNVRIALPPKDFSDKDDLWDANESNYFDNSFALEQYIKGNQMLPPKSDIYFQRIDEVMAEVKEPDWLIQDMFERESVMSIFGAAKSGKSFVAIAVPSPVARPA